MFAGASPLRTAREITLSTSAAPSAFEPLNEASPLRGCAALALLVGQDDAGFFCQLYNPNANPYRL